MTVKVFLLEIPWEGPFRHSHFIPIHFSISLWLNSTSSSLFDYRPNSFTRLPSQSPSTLICCDEVFRTRRRRLYPLPKLCQKQSQSTRGKRIALWRDTVRNGRSSFNGKCDFGRLRGHQVTRKRISFCRTTSERANQIRTMYTQRAVFLLFLITQRIVIESST